MEGQITFHVPCTEWWKNIRGDNILNLQGSLHEMDVIIITKGTEKCMPESAFAIYYFL